MSATGGGIDLEAVIRQIMESYLDGMEISSSGGDSPKKNTVTSLPEVSGFGDILDNAVRVAVLRHMEENGLVGGAGDVQPQIGEISDVASTTGMLGNARSAISASQSPVSLVSMALPLLPHAVVVSFALSMIPLILDELTRPGGVFDLRWRRMVEKEFNSLQSRQTSYDINIGERGTIFQARSGFINTQGQSSNTNSLKLIREGGINKNFLTEEDYADHSKGFDI